jgi:cytidylate kinase
VDGFSSCGKSTFARAIAKMLGYVFIDTGAMYRAVTLCALRAGAVVNGEPDRGGLLDSLARCEVRLSGDDRVFLGGEDVSEQIRSIEVSSAVSAVSGVGEVREKLVAMQQAMGRERGVAMDGRDIGTVVFPDAELKIFMTAEMSIRVRRRYDELRARGEDVSLGQIERNIRERDLLDQTREISPLRKATDAILLDNSHMTIEDQMDWVRGRLRGLGVLQ